MVVFSFYIFISAYWGFKKIIYLKEKPLREQERIKLYQTTIFEGWISVIVVVLIVIFTDITISDLGITFINAAFKFFNIWFTVGTFVISGILFLLLLYQIICFLISGAYRDQISKVLEKQKEKESHYSSVLSEIILPKNKKEKRWFTFVSISAGIGEEIIYRGFLFYLLINVLPGLPAGVLLLLGGILFGIVHSYQGLSGSLKTGLLGILLGALYLASGSLLPGIFLHFIIDFSSNFLFVSQPDVSR